MRYSQALGALGWNDFEVQQIRVTQREKKGQAAEDIDQDAFEKAPFWYCAAGPNIEEGRRTVCQQFAKQSKAAIGMFIALACCGVQVKQSKSHREDRKATMLFFPSFVFSEISLFCNTIISCSPAFETRTRPIRTKWRYPCCRGHQGHSTDDTQVIL